MPAKLTLEEISERTRNQWGGIAFLDETTFVDQKTLARFIDVKYGEWWARPFHVMKGTGRHPKRARELTRQSRLVKVEDVMRRVREAHDGRVTLRAETYVNTHVKAMFVDREYGEWLAAPYSVMTGRGHPAGKLKKSIATMRSYAPVIHWKTGEVCNPSSGFEHAVLVWLNSRQFDYDWQVPLKTSILTPKLKRPSTYFVDFYVKSGPFANTYVEVKGTWIRRRNSDGGRAKWDWLRTVYPSSQLWMRGDLVRLGIIDANRAYLDSART